MSGPAIPEGLKPLGVWDASDGAEWEFSFDARRVQQGRWAEKHLGWPRAIRRAEFYVLDGPFAVVHRYALDEHGLKHFDYATGDVAMEKPVIVPLDELPPAHLLGQG